jgi:hypothetical protein
MGCPGERRYLKNSRVSPDSVSDTTQGLPIGEFVERVPYLELGSVTRPFTHVSHEYVHTVPGMVQVSFPVPDLPQLFRLCAPRRVPGAHYDLMLTRSKVEDRPPEAPCPGMRSRL